MDRDGRFRCRILMLSIWLADVFLVFRIIECVERETTISHQGLICPVIVIAASLALTQKVWVQILAGQPF